MRLGLPAVIAVLAQACAASGPSVSWDFEGGSLGSADRVGEAAFRCAAEGQADRDGRNRQVTWYYFRLDGARGRDVSVTLTDLVGEYDYRAGAIGITGETLPLLSYDQENWAHFDTVSFDKERKELTLRLRPREDRVWVAHVEPYPWSRFERFLAEIRGKPHLQVEEVGRTVQGRPLYLFTITNRDVPEEGKRVVWTMFRQHAWESGTSFVGEGAIRFMLSDDPEARRLRDKVVFLSFPVMDPDGCAEGGVRFNRNGYDINRNWGAVDVIDSQHRLMMPEISHTKRTLHAWQDAGRRIDLFLTLHNEERGEWLSGSNEFAGLADRLFRRLKETTTFHPSEPGPRPPRPVPPPLHRMTVYEYLLRVRRIPAFIMEQRIAFNAKLGRLPTSKDRLAFGPQLARALCLTALGE